MQRGAVFLRVAEPAARRSFVRRLALGLVALPLAIRGQPTGAVPRIGWLGGPSRESADFFVSAFVEGMSELGWIEGRNIKIEWRFAGGNAERLRDLADELVNLGADLIVVPSTPTAIAARNATRTIPIVTVSISDPVQLGIVGTLSRPGGNITGLTSSVDPKVSGKQVALLHECLPRASRLAILWNPSTPGKELDVREAKTAATTLGFETRTFEVRRADDLAGAFAEMQKHRAEVLLVASDILFITHRMPLVELSSKNRLPTIYSGREYVEAGGLMMYGPVLRDLFRRAASYVDRILKGAKPSDLPMERPTKFELVINLRTAKALGISVPSSLRLQADDVIS